ncbi:MAG: hypothetical protein H7062_13880 [Candidatus Saccharimonas sp.]|nr:hypothetical protein [Planctomycetaceae bacterium]
MNSLRVIAPLVLFVAFAAAHRMAVMSRPGVQLVKATRDLEAGNVVEVKDVEKVTVTTTGLTNLTTTFVPYEDHGTVLLYNKLKRPIQKGELIALSDLQQPNDSAPTLKPDEVGVHVAMDQLTFAKGQLHVGISVGFLLEANTGAVPAKSASDDRQKEQPHTTDENSAKPELLESFKIVGIGDRVSDSSVTEGTAQRGDARVLTIAVSRDPNDKTRLSEKANRLIRAASTDPNRPERIRALVILPEPSVPPPAGGEPPASK